VGSANAASFSSALAVPTNVARLQSFRGSQSTLALVNRQSGFAESNAASTGSIIVSASGGIYVYSNTLKLVAEITGVAYPVGLALDSSGNLYISNLGTNGIPVYKKTVSG
jgi:hypothetical protein